jgi:hypothetical protein
MQLRGAGALARGRRSISRMNIPYHMPGPASDTTYGVGMEFPEGFRHERRPVSVVGGAPTLPRAAPPTASGGAGRAAPPARRTVPKRHAASGTACGSCRVRNPGGRGVGKRFVARTTPPPHPTVPYPPPHTSLM